MTARQHLHLIKAGAILAAIAWTLLLGGFVMWHEQASQREVRVLAQAQAMMALDKDLLYRRWATSKGGLYAPVDANTPPNPNLQHLPERDISTPSGRRLTLVNPAYMTRQVFEYARDTYGPIGHITSLTPLHESNQPDSWERQALQRFTQNQSEISQVQTAGNQRYLRVMRPFQLEDRCQKCHAHEGYRTGSFRGGISVTIPLAPFETNSQRQHQAIIVVMACIWLAGLAVIIWGGRGLYLGRRAVEEANRILTVRVEEEVAKNREKDIMLLQQARGGMLADVLVNIAHQWRQPLNNIALLVQQQQLLPAPAQDDLLQSENVTQVLEILKRLSRTIDDFARLYRTSGIPQPLLPSAKIREVIQIVQASFTERGIAIELQVTGETAVTCLPEDFAQCIVNILNNARDVLQARSIQPGLIRITVEPAPTAGLNRISIRDNGGGIDETLLPRIFDPYVTSKFQTQGVGLGLFIVRQLVEQGMRGSVTARNWEEGAEIVLEI